MLRCLLRGQAQGRKGPDMSDCDMGDSNTLLLRFFAAIFLTECECEGQELRRRKRRLASRSNPASPVLPSNQFWSSLFDVSV